MEAGTTVLLVLHELGPLEPLIDRAVALAAGTLVPNHFKEVADRRVAHVEKTLAAVHDRLKKEIDFWTDRWMKLSEDAKTGKDVRLNLDNAQRTVIAQGINPGAGWGDAFNGEHWPNGTSNDGNIVNGNVPVGTCLIN